MAQFLKAKFLSDALEWKFRFPSAAYYGGLRFEPYIFREARRTFADYSKLYPDNNNFTEKIVRDLRNRNPQLIKQINPDVVTPEMSAENTSFEAEAATEQQQVAQVTGQPVAQQFSLANPPATPIPTIPQIPLPPTIAVTPTAEQPPTEAAPEQPATTVAQTRQPPEAVAPQRPAITQPTPVTPSPVTRPTTRPSFQAPRIPMSFANTVRNLGSSVGVFFQRNVGKYLTAGRAATLISGGIGAAVGAGLTNGSLLGAAGGAGVGAITPSVVRSGGGTRFLSRLGNSAVNVGSNISNQVSTGGTNLRMSPTTKRLTWSLIAALFLLVFGVGIFGGLTGGTPVGETAPISSPRPSTAPVSNISSCTFYRGGDLTPGLKFNINEWPSLFSEVASKVDVPPAILAAILRVECPDCFASSNPDYIRNDYDAHGSGSSYGAMQFTPGTFAGIFNNHAAEMQSLFNKTSVRTNIDPQGAMAPADVFRIYSIRDSVIAAAFLIKDDKGSGAWSDENTVRDIASMYFSGRRLSDPANCVKYPDCNTGPYDYGADLWQSYSNCQVSPSPSPGVATSCPIQSGTVTCGSQFTPLNNCGHCGLNYPPDSYNAFCGYPGTKFALDVAGSDFQDILLPQINGSNVTWTYQGEEAGLSQAIQKYTGAVSDGAYQTYYLQFHHTQPGSGNSGTHQSGEVGGKICGNGCNEGHVHVQIGSGGDNPNNTGWLDAAQYFCR